MSSKSNYDGYRAVGIVFLFCAVVMFATQESIAMGASFIAIGITFFAIGQQEKKPNDKQRKIK